MTEHFSIAAYCRISVDDEQDRDNTSIENQRAIIADFAQKKFPGASVAYFEDRDRSGYTFEQREGYQAMRPGLMARTYDMLIVKDFSRFSRRNSRGLVELEDLRDAGVRIISIGDSIDYPTYDDWVAIQFRFLVNELPVTDTSKKVKSVIKRRQQDGKWICAVPYGYVITNTKTMAFETDEPAAEVVRMVFRLYNEGMGYKKIANHLTDLHIPTPRMAERNRKEARGEECKIAARPAWSIVTIEGMLRNDFYIGTLRQAKYQRRKINGGDVKRSDSDHIVFENHHTPIVDYRTFALTQAQLQQRAQTHYRGVKINENTYSGFLVCGDCGAPMFSMSRRDLKPAYTCGTYHRRGLKGCTSHHTRVDVLDTLLKLYIRKVRDGSAGMIDKLNEAIRAEADEVKNNDETLDILDKQLSAAREELKAAKRQKLREILKRPEAENIIEETYADIEQELENRITGLTSQIKLTADRRNTIIRANRAAKTALTIFDDILAKEKLSKADIDLVIEKIAVYENHLEIRLKADIDALLRGGIASDEAAASIEVIQSAHKRGDKIFRANVISSGDPLEIFTDREGEIILKKYSPIGELGSFAREYAESLAQTSGHIACIVDKDQIVAVSGGAKRDLLDKHISAAMENALNQRSAITATRKDTNFVPVLEDDSEAMYTHELISPIISEGDVLGAIVFLSPDKKMGDLESKLAQTAAGFLGKQMEP